MNGYPVVFVNDWCGDHKLNENNFTEPTTEVLYRNKNNED